MSRVRVVRQQRCQRGEENRVDEYQADTNRSSIFTGRVSRDLVSSSPGDTQRGRQFRLGAAPFIPVRH
jgi:hypothetical protein